VAKLDFEFDFSYEAATGRPWQEVVEELMHEAGRRAKAQLIAIAPTRTGKLRSSHRLELVDVGVVLHNEARYAEFVKVSGSSGRWRYWMKRELRNAFEDVSLERFGDVEDVLLRSIGPRPRSGQRADNLAARISRRRRVGPSDGGPSGIVVRTRAASVSTGRARSGGRSPSTPRSSR